MREVSHTGEDSIFADGGSDLKQFTPASMIKQHYVETRCCRLWLLSNQASAKMA